MFNQFPSFIASFHSIDILFDLNEYEKNVLDWPMRLIMLEIWQIAINHAENVIEKNRQEFIKVCVNLFKNTKIIKANKKNQNISIMHPFEMRVICAAVLEGKININEAKKIINQKCEKFL